LSASGQNEPLDIGKLFCVPSASNCVQATDSERPAKKVCMQDYYVSWMQEDLSKGREPNRLDLKICEKGLDVVYVALILMDLNSPAWPDFIEAENVLTRFEREEREKMFNEKAEKILTDEEETILP